MRTLLWQYKHMFRLVLYHSRPRSFIRTAIRPSLIKLHTQPISFPSRCPSCSTQLPTTLPACLSCGYISSLPPNVSFHELFGLPANRNPFNIDLPTLKRRFLEAQAVCHPDSWIVKGSVRPGLLYLSHFCTHSVGKDKKNIAQGLSTLVNEAYQSLSKPLARAEYILKCNGHEISETEPFDDVEFMSEIMEAREALEGTDAGDRERVVNDNDSAS